MKLIAWIVVFCAVFAVGFFVGQYYEANRELDMEDIEGFYVRMGKQAKDLQGEFKESIKDKLDALLD